MVDVGRVLADSPRSMRLTASMFEPSSNSTCVKPSTRRDLIIEGSPLAKPPAEVFSSPLVSLTTPQLTTAEERPFSGNAVVDEDPPYIYRRPSEVEDVSAESPGPPIVYDPSPPSSVAKGSALSIGTPRPTLSDRSITKSISADYSTVRSPFKHSTGKATPIEDSTGKLSPAPMEGSVGKLTPASAEGLAGISTPVCSEASLVGSLPVVEIPTLPVVEMSALPVVEMSTQAQTTCPSARTVTLPVRRRRARLTLPTRLSFRRSIRGSSESFADRRPIHTKSSTTSWSKIKTVCFNEDVKEMSVSNQAPTCSERMLRPQFSRSSRVSFLEDSPPPPPPPAASRKSAASLQRPVRINLQQDRSRTRRF